MKEVTICEILFTLVMISVAGNVISAYIVKTMDNKAQK